MRPLLNGGALRGGELRGGDGVGTWRGPAVLVAIRSPCACPYDAWGRDCSSRRGTRCLAAHAAAPRIASHGFSWRCQFGHRRVVRRRSLGFRARVWSTWRHPLGFRTADRPPESGLLSSSRGLLLLSDGH